MRVAIVGVGAIGGWLAASLASVPSVTVSLLARGATLNALRTQGLRITRGQGDAATEQRFAVSPSLRASDVAADLGEQDVVLLAVKGPALASACTSIAPLIGPHTCVVSAMNGAPWWFLHGLRAAPGVDLGGPLRSVDPTGAIDAAIPFDQVLGGVVHASCSTLEPGHVRQHFGNQLIVGEPSGAASARLEQVVQLLSQAGIEAKASSNIQRDIWFKLWGNVTMNPISAITGATTDRILGDERVRSFVNQVMLEAKAIGERLGLAIDQQPEDRHAVTLKLGAFKTSMLQDVEAGRALEIDGLVSAVCELAERTGVPAPGTSALLGLVRLRAQVLGLYPNG